MIPGRSLFGVVVVGNEKAKTDGQERGGRGDYDGATAVGGDYCSSLAAAGQKNNTACCTSAPAAA